VEEATLCMYAPSPGKAGGSHRGPHQGFRPPSLGFCTPRRQPADSIRPPSLGFAFSWRYYYSTTSCVQRTHKLSHFSMLRLLARRRLICLPIAAAWLLGGFLSTTSAYTPDSPEVKRAVARAAAFVEQAEDARLGAKALAGRVMIYLGKPDHPRVVEAVAAVRREIAGDAYDETRVYSLGLALAMLAELDAAEHRAELDGLTKKLVALQKPHGGWGYPHRPRGDTSMTQYALYGLWNAARAGTEVDDAVWSRAVAWLLRTQDPGGGWGYQGKEGDGDRLVPQIEIRLSMTEAALASLYLGGERFGIWKFTPREPDVGPPFRAVAEPTTSATTPKTPPFSAARYRAALTTGERWDRESTEPLYASFPCYHLYTIERFHTFRTAATKTAADDAWYDSGVDYLLKSQQSDGSWATPEGPVPATAFAVLFLMRATRIALPPLDFAGTGTLVGGRGLPLPQAMGNADGGGTTTGATSNREPNSASKPSEELEALLRRLDDPAFLAAISGVERMTATTASTSDAPAPSELRNRLIALAKSDSADEQAAALRGLGRSENFDDVPLLIEALRDPRPAVHQAAVDALRYLARRSEEIGKPLPSNEPARLAEATRWVEWFRAIRPPAR